MSAPATLMFDQIKAILTTAVTSIIPGASIVIGQPQTWLATLPCLAYFWYDDVMDVEFAGPSVIRDTYQFPIHLLVPNTAGLDEVAERVLSDLDYAILGGFRNNRRLNTTANTSTIKQATGKQKTGPIYLTHQRIEYRQRFYTLEASWNSVYNYVLG